MDCESLNKNKCFTFTWIIENYSYSWHKNDEFISSPAFVVDTMLKTKWRLKLYPKVAKEEEKDFIAVLLVREDNRGRKKFEISFDLSFLSTDGSVLVQDDKLTYTFKKNDGWGFDNFGKHDEVLKIRIKDFLPDDVLIARCRIWQRKTAVKREGHCFARTRIVVERTSLLWNLKQFSSFQKSICEINSASDGNSAMTLNFFPKSGQNNETLISIEASADDQKVKFSTLHLYLVDTSGNKEECLIEEITLDNDIKTASSKLTFSKEKLFENRDRYLLDDVLQLYCECAIATGNILQEIEQVSYGCTPSTQKVNLASDDLESRFRESTLDSTEILKENLESKETTLDSIEILKENLESKETTLDSTRILKENLESSYKKNLLCDTKLMTKSGTFHVHKCILSARSPVFKAMFTDDKRETNKECDFIEDMSDDTVQRMLLYIYTATVQDLQWGSACNLYTAADSYEILSLKSKCSSFLKDNLCPGNACDLLILANKHQDEDLKSFVQDYILNHRVIFTTNEWKLFMKTNIQLAADLMYLTLKE